MERFRMLSSLPRVFPSATATATAMVTAAMAMVTATATSRRSPDVISIRGGREPHRTYERALVAFLLGTVALACSTQETDGDANEAAVTESAPSFDATPLLVSDPNILVELEKRGLSLSKMLGATGTS